MCVKTARQECAGSVIKTSFSSAELRDTRLGGVKRALYKVLQREDRSRGWKVKVLQGLSL